jgi:hypothetical protein
MREKFLKERERVQNSGFDEKFQGMWNGFFAGNGLVFRPFVPAASKSADPSLS